jgi:hypothetical protein
MNFDMTLMFCEEEEHKSIATVVSKLGSNPTLQSEVKSKY